MKCPVLSVLLQSPCRADRIPSRDGDHKPPARVWAVPSPPQSNREAFGSVRVSQVGRACACTEETSPVGSLGCADAWRVCVMASRGRAERAFEGRCLSAWLVAGVVGETRVRRAPFCERSKPAPGLSGRLARTGAGMQPPGETMATQRGQACMASCQRMKLWARSGRWPFVVAVRAWRWIFNDADDPRFR